MKKQKRSARKSDVSLSYAARLIADEAAAGAATAALLFSLFAPILADDGDEPDEYSDE